MDPNCMRAVLVIAAIAVGLSVVLSVACWCDERALKLKQRRGIQS